MKVLAVALFLVSASAARGGVCDYRLSSLIGSGGSAATLVAGGAVAGGGNAAMSVLGLYFIPHATSGTLMLGSTLAGSSAAGTVGIIGGSGFAASVLAFLTGPITVLAAAGATATAGAMEVGCYFVDERITDYDEVLAVLKVVSTTADEKLFKLFVVSDTEAAESGGTTRIRVPNDD